MSMDEDLKSVYMRSEVDLDTPIYQYMDLDYALRMLLLGKYYVKAKCTFEDAFEGRFPWEYMLPFDVYSAKRSEEELRRREERFQGKKAEHQSMERALTSCWTLLDRENVLMWKSYTSKIGACIKTTIRKFINSIENNKYVVYCGKIGYEGYSLYHETDHFSKLNNYADERELRFYFIPKEKAAEEPTYIEFKVKPADMISEMILSPYINESSSRCLCELLKDKFKIRVTQSRIKIKC